MTKLEDPVVSVENVCNEEYQVSLSCKLLTAIELLHTSLIDHTH